MSSEQIIEIMKKHYMRWYMLKLRMPTEPTVVARVDVLFDLMNSVGITDEEIYELEQTVKK